MKRILIGLLIINLIFVNPFGLMAQEVVAESDETIATEPIDETSAEEPITDAAEAPDTEPSTTEESTEEPVADPLADEEPITDPVENPTTTEEPDPIEHPDPIEESTDNPPTDPEPEPEPTANPSPNHLIINEVMIGSEANPEKELWIELYNPTDLEINLTGWQIRGVTKGGRWVDVVNDPELSILSNDYFLLSRYSNSSYSALEFKPEMTKDSLFFPETQIHIELKNPEEIVVDPVTFEHITTTEFRAYERNCLMLDGTQLENWIPATTQINLKSELLLTYGTPHAPNSLCQQAEEPVGEPTETPVETSTEDPVEEPATGETLPEAQPDPSPDPEEQTSSAPPSSSSGYSTSTNTIAPTYPTHQLINEFMPNPEGADTENEWVELYNSTSESIELGGWYIDDAEGSSSPHQIPMGTVLAPGNYLNFREPNLKLSLKNSDDQVRLLDPNKEPKEIISYFGAQESLSYAKKPGGGFEWTPFPTPNSFNEFPAPPKTYRPDDVEFFSVLPNPNGKDDGGEKITIKNNLAEEIDLSEWAFMNQKNKEYLLGNITLPPYESIVLNPKNFGLSLVNKSDQLSLLDPAGNLIDRINWTEARSGKLIFKPNFFQDGLIAKVTHVIDGDTFVSLIDGDEFTIRLIGVDTPETVHPNKPVEAFGIEASNFSKSFLGNQNVQLIFDENKLDSYNRLLAYVYVNDELINAELIKKGLGYAYTRFPYSRMETFVELENQAKASGVGMWENEAVAEAIQTEELPEESIDNPEETESPTTELETEPPNPCPTEGLVIEAILPNSEKDVTTEFIRIKNISSQKVCLSGWKLDDNVIKGSKPFKIKGGSIAAGGIRTFRKSETNVSLNNSNDCASLINPLGDVVDQICYNKTHKNEVFTHEGGNYVPKAKKSKARASGKSTTRTTRQPTRNSIDYKWEMKNETLKGKVEFIYEDGDILYLRSEQKIIPISYADSNVDIRMTKQLLDLEKPVIVDLKTTPISRDLIAIRQEEDNLIATKKSPIPIELKYLLGLLMLISGFYVTKKRFWCKK